MKVLLVIALTVDGKSTKWDMPSSSWTSPEDQEHFLTYYRKSTLIVMGSKTYDAVSSQILPVPQTLKIILTRTPEKYASQAVPGQLEFRNATPEELCAQLEKEGYAEMLLVAGQHVNTAFFKAGLVTDVWITLEPNVFGKGNGIVTDEKLNISLKLENVERLNEQGTILLKYKVVR